MLRVVGSEKVSFTWSAKLTDDWFNQIKAPSWKIQVKMFDSHFSFQSDQQAIFKWIRCEQRPRDTSYFLLLLRLRSLNKRINYHMPDQYHRQKQQQQMHQMLKCVVAYTHIAFVVGRRPLLHRRRDAVRVSLYISRVHGVFGALRSFRVCSFFFRSFLLSFSFHSQRAANCSMFIHLP